MEVSASTERALEYIAQRANDVARAYSPGAVPNFDDVATDRQEPQMTFDPLSIATPRDSYLISSGERGRTSYTQDGSLACKDGVIVGANGSAILGFGPDAPSALGALHVDPVDLALGRVRNLRVEDNGSVAYDRDVVDPRTGARERDSISIGRLALARFPAATKLSAVDATHGSAPPGIVPHVGSPGDGNFATVEPMRREASRIDFDRSLDQLKEAYVAFDAMQAARKAQGTLGKTAMDLLK